MCPGGAVCLPATLQKDPVMAILLSNTLYIKVGLNTSFTTYIKFSPVSYKHGSDIENNTWIISIYNIALVYGT